MNSKQIKTDYSKMQFIFDTDIRETIILDRIFKTTKSEEKYGREIIGSIYTRSIPETSKFLILSRVLGYTYGIYPLPPLDRAGEMQDSMFYCAGLALRNTDKIKSVFSLELAQQYQDLDNVR
jgi:hypothetical protein